MVYTIGAFVSFAIYILIGYLVSKRVKNVEDFYVSGRNAPTLLIVGSLIASYLSTVAFMGDAAFSYDGYAIPMLIMSTFVLPGYVLGVLFFGRYLRRSKALTLPEYFGNRFNSHKVRVVASITLIVGITSYLVAVTQGAGLLFAEMTGIDYTISLIVITFIYTMVTFLSGAKGVLVTDTIMFLLFTIATFLAIPFIFQAAGGWPNAITNTANLESIPDLLSWHGITGEGAYMGTPMDVLLWCIIIGLVWGTVIAVSPWQSSRYLMAKNEHTAIRSGIIATIMLAVIYLFLHIAMAVMNAVNPSIDPSERVFIWAAINLLPTWLGVLTISGIFAAALSSSSTFLQLVGYSISRDLFKKSPIEDKRLLRLSRIVMLAVSVIVLLTTMMQPPAIFWISIFAATLFAASWGPISFASVLSKRVTKEGAFWSITAGFLGVITTELLITFNIVSLPIYLNSAVFGALAALIGLLLGTSFSKVTPEEIAFHDQLMIQPETEFNEKEIARTKKYPLILMIGGFVIILLTFVFYYIPLMM